MPVAYGFEVRVFYTSTSGAMQNEAWGNKCNGVGTVE